MVKILYSINGDGMGHATRSAALITELRKKHKVKIIVSSKRSHAYLSKKFGKVTYFEGIKIYYKNNEVDNYDTVKQYFKTIITDSSKNIRTVYSEIKKFDPDIILTDLEGTSAVIGHVFSIPIVCICNNHSLSKMKYSVPKKYRQEFIRTKIALNAIFPKADYHLITTFFYQPTKSKNVSLFPPILRREILNLNPARKNYVLVYQTSDTNQKLIDVLKRINKQFIIYGFNIDKKEGNLLFRSFNDKQFLKDFSQCESCITNGGYSFISEALSLHKPILSIPIKQQSEQTINALFIKRLGYGEFHEEADIKKISKFIKNSDKYYSNLKKFKRENNSKILAKIEEIIAKECSS